ncbi:hypothetical protein NHQ30_002825 [Ciborinia camelliae]|nr:hypothetical protein NHQ30_002825 [Ciborinia camelliae]
MQDVAQAVRNIPRIWLKMSIFSRRNISKKKPIMSFISILITPFLLTVSYFRASNYFWGAATCVIFTILLLISHFHKDDKEYTENYNNTWEAKAKEVGQIIESRIYANERKTKFRTTHLAEVQRLQSIPENQHPKSLSNMRHEMREKYTEAIKDMTSATRIMLYIHLFVSGTMSSMLLLAIYYYHNTTHLHIDEMMSSTKLVTSSVAVMVMDIRVLHKTKFWIEELERERRAIMNGWCIQE